MQGLIKLSHSRNQKQLCVANARSRNGGGGQVIEKTMQRNVMLVLGAKGVIEGF